MTNAADSFRRKRHWVTTSAPSRRAAPAGSTAKRLPLSLLFLLFGCVYLGFYFFITSFYAFLWTSTSLDTRCTSSKVSVLHAKYPWTFTLTTYIFLYHILHPTPGHRYCVALNFIVTTSKHNLYCRHFISRLQRAKGSPLPLSLRAVDSIIHTFVPKNTTRQST